MSRRKTVKLAAVTRVDRGQFQINFESLKRSLIPWRERLLYSTSMLQVDPQLILESIRRVMTFCELRDGLGTRLVWNEYRVFLSRGDHEEFVHMEPVLFAQADQLLNEYRKSFEAEIIGDLTLRLLVDDGKDLPPHVGVIQVASKVNRELDQEPRHEEEITVRLPAAARAGPRRDVAPPALDPVEATTRNDGDPQKDSLTLTWDAGSAAIGPGVRWVVGRATDPPVADHTIPLPDASTRISSRAFWIEAKEEGATIGRFDHETANAVQVKGELLMRGGEIWVYEFPASIRLTNGEMELSLERS